MSLARCIVTDLDRTLTGPDLAIDELALARIAALRRNGIRVVVATGRPFDDPIVMRLLRHVDGMVAENGAVICVPAENTLETRHADFADAARAALRELATRFTWGRVVGSAPRELDLDARERLLAGRVAHSMEYNADDVMLLPEGVSKATGSEICLRRLGLAAKDAWAIGDGENDVALLVWAEVGAAPGNAASAAKAAADVVLASSYSLAFLELTEPLLNAHGEVRVETYS